MPREETVTEYAESTGGQQQRIRTTGVAPERRTAPGNGSAISFRYCGHRCGGLASTRIRGGAQAAGLVPCIAITRVGATPRVGAITRVGRPRVRCGIPPCTSPRADLSRRLSTSRT